jgi:hypothetical protein
MTRIYREAYDNAGIADALLDEATAEADAEFGEDTDSGV